MTYLKANDYDLIKSLNNKELMIFSEVLSISADIEEIIDRSILEKDKLKGGKNMSCKKRKPRK